MPFSIGSYQIVVDSDGSSASNRFVVQRGPGGPANIVLEVAELRQVNVYGPLTCDVAPVTVQGGSAVAPIARFAAGGVTLLEVTKDGAGDFRNGVNIPSVDFTLGEVLPVSAPEGDTIVIITDSYLTPQRYLAVYLDGDWRLFGPAY